jgi:hypothetical protein
MDDTSAKNRQLRGWDLQTPTNGDKKTRTSRDLSSNVIDRNASSLSLRSVTLPKRGPGRPKSRTSGGSKEMVCLALLIISIFYLTTKTATSRATKNCARNVSCSQAKRLHEHQETE